MKKIMLGMLCIICLVGLSFGQIIKVESPNGGEIWTKGKTYTITWTTTVSDSTVKMRLFNPSATQKQFNVVESVPNTGTYDWKIPANCPTGSFLMRIRGNTTGTVDDSDQPFTIQTGATLQVAPPPKMSKITVEVTQPKAGFVCSEGNTINIKWKSSYKGSWKIGLFQDGTTKKADLKPVAEQHLGNQHQMMTKIPKGVSAYPFLKFKIRVGTSNPLSPIVGWSKTFSIKALLEVITRGLTPAERDDCGKGKKIEYAWGSYYAGGTAPTYKSVPGRSRVGFEHHLKTDGAMWYYFGYIFRSWFKFNLSEFEGVPGILRKADLIIQETETKMNPGMANAYDRCCSLLYRLGAPYAKGSCLSLPGDNLAILPHKKGGGSSANVSEAGSRKWKVDIRNTVRNWLNHPETNHGLLLIPFKESLDKSEGNTFCASYYIVKLVIEYVPSKK